MALEQFPGHSFTDIILIYKAMPTPIWTYGIQLWGMASISNIEILECFQSKVLHMIVDTLCLSIHPDNLAVNLIAQTGNRQL
jgi:hypothetical protein